MPVRSAMEDAPPRLTVKEPPQEVGCVCARQATQETASYASVGDCPYPSGGNGVRQSPVKMF